MQQIAILAAGCFWGVQFYFDQVPGVINTEVGYTGGKTDNPSYEAVCTHTTGHAEAVKIIFDSSVVTYKGLLKQFFHMHDPTQLNRQGPDVGDSYRSEIFYVNDKQKSDAEELIKDLNTSEYKGKIMTSLEVAKLWWPAEDYHQKFTDRTGQGMCHIPYSSLA